MATTPQTNATLPEIAAELRLRDNFVICGHVSPDGDCIGSQLALMHALRSIGKTASCVLAEEGTVDAGLSYLPGFDELVPASRFEGPIGVFVGVDVPTVQRIGEASALHAAAGFAVTIDHHACETAMAQMVHVDPDAASCSMLVWRLASCLMDRLTPEVAQCAYTGLITDTGRFQFQNTDAAALQAAAEMVEAGADPALAAREVFQNRSLASVRLEARAIERMRFDASGQAVISWISAGDFEELGAVKADAEPLIDVLRAVKGVRIACMLREQPDAIRGSFRAKDDTDVSELARSYGGGGHRAAAGFTLHGDLEEAVRGVLHAMEGLLAPSGERVE